MLGHQGRELRFRNDSSEEVPAFSVVRVTGIAQVNTDHTVVTVDKPNTFGSQYSHYLTGPYAVPSGSQGRLQGSYPAVAEYDETNTPAFGEAWGPTDDSFELKQHVGEFQILGRPDNGRVLVSHAPMLGWRVKLDAIMTHDIELDVVPTYWDDVASEWTDHTDATFKFTVRESMGLSDSDTVVKDTIAWAAWEPTYNGMIITSVSCRPVDEE